MPLWQFHFYTMLIMARLKYPARESKISVFDWFNPHPSREGEKRMSVDNPNLAYRIIKRIVKTVYKPFEYVGLENLPEEAAVIVGNHSQLHGPLSMEVYRPRKSFIWCVAEMTSFTEVSAYAYKDFWSNKPKGVRWIYKIASWLIAPLCYLLFNNAKVIPVYRDTRLLGTFKNTVKRLDEGADVVIFPESYTPYNEIVYDFQKGFEEVAPIRQRVSGKPVYFVPMYICPELKKISFGAPTKVEDGKPLREELDRIRVYLMDEITRMAKALPRHRVVPYPNMAKKDWPYSK